MFNWNRKELENHLDVLLKYDFNSVPIDYIESYKPKVPTKFYKYRTFKNMHLKAIEEDYIWLSLAKDFPDKSDSTINYSFKKQFKNIETVIKELMPELVFNEIKKYLTKGGKVNPSVFKDITLEDAIDWMRNHTYSSGRFNYKKTRSYMRSMKASEKQINEFEKKTKEMMSKENIKIISEKFLDDLSLMNDRFREMYYIHSFSSVKDNSFLWDTYTNDDEGFCIEYDIAGIDKEIIQMLPILYTPIEDIKMDQLIKIAIMNHQSKVNKTDLHELSLKVFSHLLTKNPDYNTESEWRLIVNKSKHESNEYYFPFISAIYLGSNMKEHNKKRMINIATKKGISVYQRERSKLNTEYIFTKIL
ncbi:MAG TPA: DUF2971 domain-containing protein [Gallicola sp.]|nr:DUF2971 domain-containing protein [Gallicola sp.]